MTWTEPRGQTPSTLHRCVSGRAMPVESGNELACISPSLLEPASTGASPINRESIEEKTQEARASDACYDDMSRAEHPCTVCGQAAASYRRCTAEYICSACRCLAEHRVVTEAAALRALAVTWNCHMTRAELRDSLEPLSRIPNRVNRRWPMELLYRYSSLELVAGAARPSSPPS